jgi:predicted DNA-binding transcriptional regulator YafY
MKLSDIKMVQRRRLAFIEFHLLWEGEIGRRKLQEQFGISAPQATKDLSTYVSLCPDAMHYDPRQKAYIPTKDFQPIIASAKSDGYLRQLEMHALGYRTLKGSWPSVMPAHEITELPTRTVDPDILRTTLWAIENKSPMVAVYTSMTGSPVEPRMLLPHALANDRSRWHVRAYDVAKKRFSDFVMSRFKSATRCSEQAEAPVDEDWERYVVLQMEADPNAEEMARRAVEYEHGMTNGKLELRVRQAMLSYMLRTYGFVPFKGHDLSAPSALRLSLVEPDIVEAWLGWR